MDLSGWMDVGLGGNYDIRCGILYAPMLYKTLLARKLSQPEDGRYRPKHIVFPLLINTII